MIWNKLYPCIVDSKGKHISDEVFNSYLLNPNLFSDQWREWFKFDKRGLDFYKRIAHDRGSDERVLFAIAKNTISIGKNYISQFIPIISEMLTTNSYISIYDKNKLSGSIFYLQNIISEELSNNEAKVKDNSVYRQCVLNILSFMERSGSAWAAEIMRTF